MMEVLASIIIGLLGVIGTLTGVMYWDLRRQIRTNRAMTHNYTTSVFRLLHRLNPGSGAIIGDAMLEMFAADKANGKAIIP